ncbi:MAG: hypothetical protein ACLQIS_15335 [Bryobacteraceae bacterium]
MEWPAGSVVGWFLKDQDRGLECAELLLILLLLVSLWLCPHVLGKRMRAIGSALLKPFQRCNPMALVLVCLAPLALRIALLPAVPPPIPVIADEFGHLFLADTLASGRLANPPHPMAQHFETLYILQRPVCASIYPPGHGLVMAFAQWTGLDPWFGVVAETGVMLLALAWMLRAWFPSRWVLLGLLIAIVRLGVWMNCYWGGSLAAAGGALLVGAITRLARRPRTLDGFMLALGLTILVSTRPYEALLLGLMTVVALGEILFRSRRVPSCGAWRPVLAATACSLAVGAALTGYYNYRVGGNPLLFPYFLSQQQYGVPQSLSFQAPVPPPVAKPYQDVMDTYWWQRGAHDRSGQLHFFWDSVGRKLAAIWHFYLHPLCSIPLLLLPCVLRSLKMRLLAGVGLFVTLGTWLYPLYFPHYSAPVAGILIVVLVQGLRHLSALTRHTRAGGLMIPGSVVLVACVGMLLSVLALFLHTTDRGRQMLTYPSSALMRHEIEKRFVAAHGKHLILVRYAPFHIFHRPVIYNRARVDESAVVWARELGPPRDEELLRYYSNRTAWLFEPDEKPPRIGPYPRAPTSR